jgi:hypothetical protein
MAAVRVVLNARGARAGRLFLGHFQEWAPLQPRHSVTTPPIRLERGLRIGELKLARPKCQLKEREAKMPKTDKAFARLGSKVAIKLGTPLKTLADVIHPFPAFNRVLGASLDELAAKVAR